MANTQVRSYAGQTGAERVQQRRQALIEAALDATDLPGGWRNLTVDRLARGAGLSKRYFYESFTDLDDLVTATVDHTFAELQEAGLSALGVYTDITELARATIAAVVVHLTDDPRRARLIFGEMSASEAVQHRRSQAMRHIAAVLVAHARILHNAGDRTDTIIDTAATFLIGGTGQTIMSWLRGELDCTREELVDDLTSLWLITGNGAAEHAWRRQPATEQRQPESIPDPPASD